MSERTALYRVYDAADALLYVGISGNFGRRWEQHAKVQPWWPEVHRQTVEWHPDWDAALDAEKAAIEGEAPLHNVIHKPEGPGEMSIRDTRASFADVVNAAIRGRITYITSRGRRVAAVVPLAVAEDQDHATKEAGDAI